MDTTQTMQFHHNHVRWHSRPQMGPATRPCKAHPAHYGPCEITPPRVESNADPNLLGGNFRGHQASSARCMLGHALFPTPPMNKATPSPRPHKRCAQYPNAKRRMNKVAKRGKITVSVPSIESAQMHAYHNNIKRARRTEESYTPQT